MLTVAKNAAAFRNYSDFTFEKAEEACHAGSVSWTDGALRRWAALASDQRHREDSGPIVSGRVCSISIGPKAESCGIYCLLFTARNPHVEPLVERVLGIPRGTHTVVEGVSLPGVTKMVVPCVKGAGASEGCLDVSACLLSSKYPALRVPRDNGCT